MYIMLKFKVGKYAQESISRLFSPQTKHQKKIKPSCDDGIPQPDTSPSD